MNRSVDAWFYYSCWCDAVSLCLSECEGNRLHPQVGMWQRAEEVTGVRDRQSASSCYDSYAPPPLFGTFGLPFFVGVGWEGRILFYLTGITHRLADWSTHQEFSCLSGCPVPYWSSPYWPTDSECCMTKLSETISHFSVGPLSVQKTASGSSKVIIHLLWQRSL